MRSTSITQQPVAAAIWFLALLLIGPFVSAQTDDTDEGPLFYRQHQAGVRIGVWGSLGESPAQDTVINDVSRFFSDIGDASFYLEGFFGYRFSSFLMGEFSVGVVSRGDVSRSEVGTNLSPDVGTLMVYPILAKLKFYPFREVAGRFHPFLFGGGGIYHARHDIQIIGSSTIAAGFLDEESATSFSYALGGGFDWPVSKQVGLEFHTQYLPINFGDALIGVKDWSSLTFTVGVKYLFEPNPNDNKR
jgi:opacity protein-like surface antigen